MVVERKVIDIEQVTEVEALTRELDEHPDGLVLRRNGRPIATLSEVTDPDASGADRGRVVHPLTGERLQTFLHLVHEIAPSIDADRMHRNNAESRQVSIDLQRQRMAEPGDVT